MKKFKNKYRIASTRLPNWDYGSDGLYFVTICCKDRQWFFGEIDEGKMVYSKIGDIAEKCWLEIPQHFPFVILHNHVIMPNHVHGVIQIAKHGVDDVVTDGSDVTHDVDVDIADRDDTHWDDTHGDDTHGDVETQNFASLPPPQPSPIPSPISSQPRSSSPPSSVPHKNKFGPQSKNLASIIRGFKIGVTKNARLINPNFYWQARYHDHIIRNEKSFYHISNYITNNPILWKEDKFFGKE